MPKTNAEGIALIQSFESCRLEAYPDPATGGDPWTNGWGHTGPEVKPGTVITQEQADETFLRDLSRFEQAVQDCCAVNLTSNQFSALVSFEYNTGALAHSTLMRLVNAGNFAAAADQFSHWVWANGKVMPGLVRRRAAERALFLKP